MIVVCPVSFEIFGDFEPIRRKRSFDVALGSDGFVRAITGFAAFKLINILADQVTFNSVADHKGQAFLQDFKFAQGPLKHSRPTHPVGRPLFAGGSDGTWRGCCGSGHHLVMGTGLRPKRPGGSHTRFWEVTELQSRSAHFASLSPTDPHMLFPRPAKLNHARLCKVPRSRRGRYCVWRNPGA
jgi:hypothetical protein